MSGRKYLKIKSFLESNSGFNGTVLKSVSEDLVLDAIGSCVDGINIESSSGGSATAISSSGRQHQCCL